MNERQELVNDSETEAARMEERWIAELMAEVPEPATPTDDEIAAMLAEAGYSEMPF